MDKTRGQDWRTRGQNERTKPEWNTELGRGEQDITIRWRQDLKVIESAKGKLQATTIIQQNRSTSRTYGRGGSP